ncbi:unnamed protein product, partial [marine sediment metagenome]
MADYVVTQKVSADRKSALSQSWAVIREFAREKPLGAAAGGIFIVWILVAIVGPWITPMDPTANNIVARLSPPSSTYLMGTDAYGRDMLSRIIAGTRIAMTIGVTASFLGSTLGMLLGIISGYLGGKVDMFM